MPLELYKQALEDLYKRYNRREFVHPDPLEFLYRYSDDRDRELVALLASCLAYGRVQQILKSIAAVLAHLGPRPAAALADLSRESLQKSLAGFRHRFATGRHVSALLTGVKAVMAEYGSLEQCFASGISGNGDAIRAALCKFTNKIRAGGGECGHLLADPSRASACKRLNLFLRWMVRRDEVDVGCWRAVERRMLIVPLDTHMHRISLAMGLTQRKSADMTTAVQITAAFREICPDDPVRYDFALTRLGIRDDADINTFVLQCKRLSNA